MNTRAGHLSIALLFALLMPAAAAPQMPATELAPHRAIYELTLQSSRGTRPIESVRGRILYDFNGNSCEGYALQFRQVSEIDTGEGKVLMSDLRAATWEDGAARAFRFTSENYLNENLVDAVDGSAERRDSDIGIGLKKPEKKTFSLEQGVIFPTEHMRRIIEAARAGEKLLDVAVYDGSETGEKVYNTLTVIGQSIAPSDTDDAAKGNQELAKLRRWPVTISYFDRAKREGEQEPAYSIGFELYENGISRKLTLDYNDFVISGRMSQLELKPASACAK
ncbi:MAG TPA: cell envelope integrity EipB family protein [Pseudorhodoplanes sp.]|jgi:hypothetical protein|nr:cell envelope integrity EipB family protein [Pseudorhodoplanes sp.]